MTCLPKTSLIKVYPPDWLPHVSSVHYQILVLVYISRQLYYEFNEKTSKMNKICLYLGLLTVILCTVSLSCKQSYQRPGDIPIYIVPSQENQPGTKPESNAPIIPSPKDTKEDYVIRNIVVDQRNSIFSIGIPVGQREITKVVAEKPIDFWFEYLTAEVKLEVNGVEVQRNPFHWETKIGYTKSVTQFEYQIFNTTGSPISYNLHLLPSVIGESVHVTVRQRWIP